MYNNFVINAKKTYKINYNPVLDNYVDKVSFQELELIDKQSEPYEFKTEDIGIHFDKDGNLLVNKDYANNLKYYKFPNDLGYSINLNLDLVVSDSDIIDINSELYFRIKTFSVFNNIAFINGERIREIYDDEDFDGLLTQYFNMDKYFQEENIKLNSNSKAQGTKIGGIEITVKSFEKGSIIYNIKTNLFNVINDTNTGGIKGYYALKFEITNFNNFYKTIKSTNYEVGVGDSVLSLKNNPFFLNTTHYGNTKICGIISDNIIENYKNGKKTISIEMPLQKLYNENEELIYDNDKGQIPNLGDTFKVIKENDTRDSEYNITENKSYVITSSEFSYNGVPKIIIKGKEKNENGTME